MRIYVYHFLPYTQNINPSILIHSPSKHTPRGKITKVDNPIDKACDTGSYRLGPPEPV